MSRLPFVDPEHTSPELRAAFAKMPAKLNVFRMLAHAENTALPAGTSAAMRSTNPTAICWPLAGARSRMGVSTTTRLAV